MQYSTTGRVTSVEPDRTWGIRPATERLGRYWPSRAQPAPRAQPGRRVRLAPQGQQAQRVQRVRPALRAPPDLLEPLELPAAAANCGSRRVRSHCNLFPSTLPRRDSLKTPRLAVPLTRRSTTTNPSWF